MADRRPIVAVAAALAVALAGCDADESSGEDEPPEPGQGVVYGVSDDQELLRWEVGSDDTEPVLDLSGVWEHRGDVGMVLTASLTIDPTQRHAAWIAGGSDDSELMIGDLETGEAESVTSYPLDHACLEPAWAPDGSKLLVHRAPVWDESAEGEANQAPLPDTAFGQTAWYTAEGFRLTDRVDLDRGCRLRWYTTEGKVEGLYRDLAVTELRRVDEDGHQIETAPLDAFAGVNPQVIDLVEVDPTGRYACLADGLDDAEPYEGGFTMRPETGTNVIDLETGKSVGSACESLQTDVYLARKDGTVALADYEGEVKWETALPPEIVHSPNLWYFP